LQVAIMLTLMFNLVQFTWWTCKRQRRGTMWQVHGPTFMVLLSAILVNIQPILILIIGSWELCCSDCTGHVYVNSDKMQVPFLANCTSSGKTYPPWPATASVARECSSGGNIFWDISYCSGQKYPIFPTVLSGWMIRSSVLGEATSSCSSASSRQRNSILNSPTGGERFAEARLGQYPKATSYSSCSAWHSGSKTFDSSFAVLDSRWDLSRWE